MTKIDIFSGFLGAGKTTLIRKLIAEGYKNEKLVLIENEFGEIAVDGGFLKDAGVEITEMNSGCICCTLVGDFTKALKKVIEEHHPDRILIEPSGVGKLSDVAKAVAGVEGAEIGAKVTVVDAGKCRMYIRNFGEFFNDQVQHADVIVLSRTDSASDGKVVTASAMLSQLNPNATVITTPWSELSGEQIVQVMERIDSLSSTMQEMTHFHEHETTMTTSMSMTTRMSMTMSTSTSMTTTTTTATTAPAAAVTTTTMTTQVTTMPTRCSPPGALRRRRSSVKRKFVKSSASLTIAGTTAPSFVPRALSIPPTASGCTLTMFRARSTFAAAALPSPAGSASSVQR